MACPFNSRTICVDPSGAATCRRNKPARKSSGPISRPPTSPPFRLKPPSCPPSMSMNPLSRIVETLKHGSILDVAIEELQFRAYIVISEPDIERVADFVPKEQFEQDRSEEHTSELQSL